MEEDTHVLSLSENEVVEVKLDIVVTIESEVELEVSRTVDDELIVEIDSVIDSER